MGQVTELGLPLLTMNTYSAYRREETSYDREGLLAFLERTMESIRQADPLYAKIHRGHLGHVHWR